jgi:hypothetical protein
MSNRIADVTEFGAMVLFYTGVGRMREPFAAALRGRES